MSALLVKRILQGFVSAFGKKEALEILRREDSRKYVNDISGIDSVTREAKLIRLAIGSGIFKELNGPEGLEVARSALQAASGCGANEAEDVVSAFADLADIMRFPVIPGAGSAFAMRSAPRADEPPAVCPADRGQACRRASGGKIHPMIPSPSKLSEFAHRMYFETAWTEEEFQSAVLMISEAAEDGDPDALADMLWLDRIKETDLGERRRKDFHSRALEAFIRKANEERNVCAMVKAGDLMRDAALGKPRNAYNWYKSASDSGSGEAMLRIGDMYRDGIDTQKNPVQAFSWYERSADCGCAEGLLRLAECHGKGIGTGLNIVKSREMLENSASEGCPEALYRLGLAAEMSEETGSDENSAFASERRKSLDLHKAAANMGESRACVRLGSFYHAESEELSDGYFRKAIHLGNPRAMFLKARKMGLRQGPEYALANARTIRLCERAALLGCIEAMRALGKMFTEGKFARRDARKAFRFYEMAAFGGDAESMGRISQMLYSGIGTEANLELAQEWFERAEKARSKPVVKTDSIWQED